MKRILLANWMVAGSKQGAAVRRKFLYVPDAQTMRREDVLCCVEGQVGEMLVVNGVELPLCHQLQQVRKLERYGAARRKRGGQPGDEIIDVWHVSQNVVGDSVSLGCDSEIASR